MRAKFSNNIAIGVADKDAAANRFVTCFEAAITRRAANWVEVSAPPYTLYFVEDGTNDIAFAAEVPEQEVAEMLVELEVNGFPIDRALTERTKETFVRDADGILILVEGV